MLRIPGFPERSNPQHAAAVPTGTPPTYTPTANIIININNNNNYQKT